MKNNESLEMYLETIYTISQTNPNLHAIDIANALGYSKPSVSRAMKILLSNNFIEIASNGVISLTPEGLAKAKSVYDRHVVLTKILMQCGADKDLAEENACRIEHVISDDLFVILKNYLEK